MLDINLFFLVTYCVSSLLQLDLYVFQDETPRTILIGCFVSITFGNFRFLIKHVLKISDIKQHIHNLHSNKTMCPQVSCFVQI